MSPSSSKPLIDPAETRASTKSRKDGSAATSGSVSSTGEQTRHDDAPRRSDEHTRHRVGGPDDQGAPQDRQLETTVPDAPLPDKAAYSVSPAGTLLPPPDFKPFFTLIEDSATGEHHHPAVHYLFQDDDPEDFTHPILDALERHDPPEHGAARLVIIDVAADGRTIASASSLSTDWQALKTTVSRAPSWRDDAAADAERGVMLTISGTEVDDVARTRRAKMDGSAVELVRAFGEGLTVLDETLGRVKGRDDVA